MTRPFSAPMIFWRRSPSPDYTSLAILADREPAPPTRQPFEPVEFDGLTATPYVTDRGRMAYSLRASGIKAGRAVAHAPKDAA